MKVNKQLVRVGSLIMWVLRSSAWLKGPCPLSHLTGPTFFIDSFPPVYRPPIHASFQVSKPFC